MWTPEITNLFETAIGKVGGWRVAKPAAVLDEMKKSGGEQGLPTKRQVADKLYYLLEKQGIKLLQPEVSSQTEPHEQF